MKIGHKTIKQHVPSNASIEIFELDLKSLTSVKHFAQKVLSKHNQIHLLINNGTFKISNNFTIESSKAIID